MKKTILAVILLGLVFSSVAYGKTVTGWERKVYYDATDKVYQLSEGYTNDDYNRVLRQVAGENGLTFGEMKDIVDRVWDQDLTDHEWQIFEELDGRLMALPKGSSQEESDRIYREIASKYSVSLNVLYDIDERGWWWWF